MAGQTDVRVDAESTEEQILEEAAKQPEEDETSEESSTTEESTDKSGEDVKTQEEEKEPASEEPVDEGKPIPYKRFKQVNDEKAKFASEKETLQKERDSLKEELETSRNLLNDPEVLRRVMKKEGYADEAIAKEIADRGLVAEPKPSGEYDFTKQEDWQKYISDQVEQRVAKIQQETAQVKQQVSARETTIRLDREAKEADILCKELGIEYGDEEKDIENTDKAVGLIDSFITKNPMKGELMKRGLMSKSEALILALKGKGFKIGEQKGVEKEKARQEDLKNGAMESEEKLSKADVPNADWPEEKLLEYASTHPNAKVNY